MTVASHHLYVHVPFCRLVCAYCDFVTVAGRTGDIAAYVEALMAEMRLRATPGRLQTVYFGGGTPSLLGARDVERVLATAAGLWAEVRLEEVTLEANPSRREAPDWAGMRAAGVTRISLGVQSLRDAELIALARGHRAEEGIAAFRAVRAAGFTNVSLDLIYGIGGQSLANWREGLAAAIDLCPEHVSLYALQLALEPDEWAAPPRPGALRWRRRMAARQDDDLAADQYDLAEELLERAGYVHYELSSWALPGHASLHNGAYWDRRAYTGIGAGAHSYDGATERTWNVRDLDAYLRAVRSGLRPLGGRETLDEPTRAFEAIALGLRRVGGIDRRAFAAEFGADPLMLFARGMEDASRAGLLELGTQRVRLTPAGRLLAGEALVGFLAEAAGAR